MGRIFDVADTKQIICYGNTIAISFAVNYRYYYNVYLKELWTELVHWPKYKNELASFHVYGVPVDSADCT